MKLLRWKIAIVAVVSSSISAMACEADLVCVGETIANRNCVMCHGPSFQGYFVAPRLAGQRPQYVENQLKNFRAHSRDNPYSQLYMWRAAAKLDTQWGDQNGYRAVAAYFATLRAQGRQGWQRGTRLGGRFDLLGRRNQRQRAGLRGLPWPECCGVEKYPAPWRPLLQLLEEKAGAVGRRLSYLRVLPDADRGEPPVGGADRSARFLFSASSTTANGKQ